MEIYFLGTGAGMPSRERNVTSIALKLFAERGTFWLFDCGEATQHQVLNSSLKLSKLEKLFITHLHGDHLYGLPGLLTSRSNQEGSTPLTIYGPPGISEFVNTVLSISQARVEYPLEIVDVEDGILFKDQSFTVEAARIEHRIESFGYRVMERDQPGRLRVEKLKEHGIEPGPIYAEIKQGKDIILPGGQRIKAADYVDPAYPGRVVVMMGDTRICEPAQKLSMDADVLVHEATFSENLKHLAYKYFHTTATEAANLAKDCRVSTLIMTHISSRYQGRDAEAILEEARNIFPNTYLAQDHWSYYLSRKDCDTI